MSRSFTAASRSKGRLDPEREVLRQERLGGIRRLGDLRGPFPEIPLIPTGGVDRDNAQAYLAAGAFAVGVGSALSEGGADVSAATTEWLMRCRR